MPAHPDRGQRLFYGKVVLGVLVFGVLLLLLLSPLRFLAGIPGLLTFLAVKLAWVASVASFFTAVLLSGTASGTDSSVSVFALAAKAVAVPAFATLGASYGSVFLMDVAAVCAFLAILTRRRATVSGALTAQIHVLQEQI